MRNWYVITGGPSSGKTTLVDVLSARGHRTVPEAARVVIDEHLKRGGTIAQIRADEAAFQDEVLERKFEVESGLTTDEIVFLDRGIPDTIAYFWACGLPEYEGLAERMKSSHYAKVFLLDRLPLQADYARVEDDELAAQIDQALERAYAELGMPVVRVPVLPFPARAEYVLARL